MNLKCPNCGFNNSNYYEQHCKNCKTILRTKFTLNTDFYGAIAWLVLILGIIGGFYMGKAFSTNNILGTSYGSDFNFTIALYCWIGTLLFDVFIFGIYSICYRLDLLIKK